MDDLAAVRAQSVPRDTQLSRRLARRLVPAWGFVAYGILYAFVALTVALLALVGAAVSISSVLGSPLPSWHPWVLYSLSLAAFALTWWPFAWWVRRRRGAAHALIRDGELVEAEITGGQRLTLRGAPFTRATLQLPDGRRAVLSVGGHPAELVEGARLPVVTTREARYCAAFLGGRVISAAF